MEQTLCRVLEITCVGYNNIIIITLKYGRAYAMAAIRGWLLFLSMSSRYNYYYSGCIFLVYLNEYGTLRGGGSQL